MLTHVECMKCGSEGPKIAYVDDVRAAWSERIQKMEKDLKNE